MMETLVELAIGGGEGVAILAAIYLGGPLLLLAVAIFGLLSRMADARMEGPAWA